METPLSVEDRQYLSLLSHLRKPSPKVPVQTIKSTLPYYLAHLAIEHVTTLTATALASGYWLPVSVDAALTFGSAFRHAFIAKLKNIEEEKRNSIFSLTRSVQSQLRTWVQAVLKGSSSGNVYLRLCIYGGVNSGILDVQHSIEGLGSLASTTQNAFVAAVASDFQDNTSSWNAEFSSSEVLDGMYSEGYFPCLLTSNIPILDNTELRLAILAEYLTKVRPQHWHSINLQVCVMLIRPSVKLISLSPLSKSL
jgi:hypothetical protein